MIFNADVRSIWYSLSPSVWDGATTILSPVCTPTGSIFSILHTVMQFPAASRITSYSISFQPAMQRSTSTSPTRLKTQSVGKDVDQFLLIMRDSAAASAKCVGRTQYDRITDGVGELNTVFHIVHDQGSRHRLIRSFPWYP